MPDVRPTAVAGIFYPDGPGELARDVDRMIASAGDVENGADRASDPAAKAIPKAIIVPHAGYHYSGAVAARAYARIFPGGATVRRAIVLGPSHRVPFRGVAMTKADAYATPLGSVPIDREARNALESLPFAGYLEEAHNAEHSIEVQLPFLSRVLPDYQLTPLVVGALQPERVAEALDLIWGGPETLIVVSTDLSHYLDDASAREKDAATAALIEAFDVDGLDPNGACGRTGLAGLLAAARRRSLTIERLDLKTSADVGGGRDRVVGYGAWAVFEPEGTQPKESE